MPDATDFDLESGSEVRVIASSKPKVNWGFILFIIIVVTVGVVLVFRKDEKTKTKEENLEKAAAVFKTIDEEESKLAQLGYTLPPGTGRIIPHESYVWSASCELSGKIIKINKGISDKVAKGETLVILENAEILKAQKQNKIAIKQAKERLQYFESKRTGAEYKTFSDAVANAVIVRDIINNKLEISKDFEGVTVSSVEISTLTEELALANNSLKLAEAALESFNRKTNDEINEQKRILETMQHEGALIQQKIKSLEIKAPSNMNVLEIHVQNGEIIEDGHKIITLYDPMHINVRLFTAYMNFSRFDIGRKAKIFIDSAPNRSYQGEVIALHPLGRQSKNNFEVIVSFLNPDRKILVGCTAQIEFVKEK